MQDVADMGLHEWTTQAVGVQATWSGAERDIAAFTGTEADASEVEMLEMTWDMFVPDLEALGAAAGADPNRQELAINVHAAGVTLGSAITAYKDAVGEHSLKELESAAQTFGQWVAAPA